MAIKISGSTIIDDTRNLVSVNHANVGGALTAINFKSRELRFITGSEKTTRVNGNTANLVYNTESSNIAICTNPNGNITLNVTGIPETSDFNDHCVTFTVLSRATTGVAYSCLSVTMNGTSKTISWVGGNSQVATAGLTTTNGYTIYSFSGINPIGSASSCANYVILGTVSGGYF
jgi:hypothetical protein